MKRTTLLLCFLASLSLAQAQLFSLFGFELGFSPSFHFYPAAPLTCAHPEGGLHLSIQPQVGIHRLAYTSDGPGRFMSSRWGEHYGAQLTLAADAPLAFETGILLLRTDVGAQQLSELDLGLTDIGIETLKVPFAFSYRLGDPDAPIYARLNAGATLNTVLDVDPRSGQSRLDYRPAYWALRGGAGLDFFFLTLDLQTEIGISQIFEDNPAPRSRMWVLSLGMRL